MALPKGEKKEWKKEGGEKAIFFPLKNVDAENEGEGGRSKRLFFLRSRNEMIKEKKGTKKEDTDVMIQETKKKYS